VFISRCVAIHGQRIPFSLSSFSTRQRRESFLYHFLSLSLRSHRGLVGSRALYASDRFRFRRAVLTVAISSEDDFTSFCDSSRCSRPRARLLNHLRSVSTLSSPSLSIFLTEELRQSPEFRVATISTSHLSLCSRRSRPCDLYPLSLSSRLVSSCLLLHHGLLDLATPTFARRLCLGLGGLRRLVPTRRSWKTLRVRRLSLSIRS